MRRELDLRCMNVTALPASVADFPRLTTLRAGAEYPAPALARLRQLLPRDRVVARRTSR